VTEPGTQFQNEPARDCDAETHSRVPVSGRERAMSHILKYWDGSWPPPTGVSETEDGCAQKDQVAPGRKG
jgi:hypothetical protein